MSGDDVELRLDQAVKYGLPAVVVVGTGVAFATAGLGPAILAAASGALATAIVTVWASLRSLGEFDQEQVQGDWQHSRVESAADETKLALLRTLKDLEHERDVGKLGQEDYAALSAKYRGQLKVVLAEMDRANAPHVQAAERLAASYLAARAGEKVAVPLAPKQKATLKSATTAGASSRTPPTSPRRACAECSESNEPDATFCKKCGQKLLGDSGDHAIA